MMLMVDPLPPAFLQSAQRLFATVAHSGSQGTAGRRTANPLACRRCKNNFGMGPACATPP